MTTFDQDRAARDEMEPEDAYEAWPKVQLADLLLMISRRITDASPLDPSLDETERDELLAEQCEWYLLGAQALTWDAEKIEAGLDMLQYGHPTSHELLEQVNAGAGE